jgi:hypothetical protein
VAKTLAYYNMATITAIKSFIVQAPDLLGKSSEDIVDVVGWHPDSPGRVFQDNLKYLAKFFLNI